MADMLLLKITLEGIEPAVWRRVLVPAALTYRQLHEVLQVLFDWNGWHLYAYNVGKATITEPDLESDWEGTALDAYATGIGGLLGRRGATGRYEYDFGDSWLHTIRVEAVEDQEEITPRCLDGACTAPPEDSGGPWGYRIMLEALADPQHPDHEQYAEWLPEGWAPEAFDREAINAALRDLEEQWAAPFDGRDFFEMDAREALMALPLSVHHEGLLRAVDFGAESPGPLLHDFNALLGYVADKTPRLTARGAPQPADLRRMSRLLLQPLRADLPRPGRRDVPDVYGLFLLLRASGLSLQVQEKGHAHLTVDAELRSLWDTFTPADQYGHLLESWLFHIQDLFDDNVLGFEGAGPWLTFHVLWSALEAGSYDYSDPAEGWAVLDNIFGLPQLALAASFGWVELVRNDPDGSSEPLRPVRGARALPLGEAILARIWKRVEHDELLQAQLTLGDDPLEARGRLRGLFLPYWPGWRRTLPLPEARPIAGRYSLQVRLDSASWRVVVPGGILLSQLANLLLETVGHQPEHLYRFLVPDVRFGGLQEVGDPLLGDPPTATQITLADLELGVGMILFFHYDFNHDLYYDVEVEDVEEA